MLIKRSKIPFIEMITIGMLPSFLKKVIYRIKGYSIGKNVSIGIGSVILGEKTEVCDNVKIGHLTVIRGDDIFIDRFATIGSFSFIDSGNIKIGEDSRINEQVIIGGMKTPHSKLDLGKRTIIMEYSYINTTLPIEIGDDTGIGGHCLLFTHGSWLSQLDGFPVTFAPIKIGKNVWLPWRVFIMPGVEIGDKVVIGANSLITKNVESNSLVAGSPAKVIKENYPGLISLEKKITLFKSYISEFVEHLKYNGLNVTSETDSNSVKLTGSTKYISFTLVAFLTEIEEIPAMNKDSLIILNVGEEHIQLQEIINKECMIIDVFNKKRLGTSEVGEEFTKFVSRYGLRFSREDPR